MSVAVGPLGRNGELSGSVNTKGKLAAMYSYSKTKGLFGGLSIEGSVILERQDANCTAYGEEHVTSKMLLTGVVPPPPWASSLIETLERSTGDIKGWIQEGDEDVPSPARALSPDGGPAEYAFGGGVSGSATRPKMKNRSSLFAGSADSVRKAFAQPFAGPPKHSFASSNPADEFLDNPKKGVGEASAGILHVDDDYDEPYTSSRVRSTDSPFSELNPSKRSFDRDASPSRGSPEPSLNNPFSRLHLEDDIASSTKPARNSRFSTHFESDFNPLEPKGKTPLGTHQRGSSSISSFTPSVSGNAYASPAWPPPSTLAPTSESTQEDDDPFGIFGDPTPQPSGQALPPSNLNYRSSIGSRGGRSSYERDQPTPPLTNAASSVHSRQSISSPPISPTAVAFSPTFQRHLENWQSQKDRGERTEREVLYHPEITSPKPQRSLGRSLSVKKELRTPVEPGLIRAIVLFDYDAQEVWSPQTFPSLLSYQFSSTEWGSFIQERRCRNYNQEDRHE